MNKEEFLKKLRKRLEVLEDKEISDILSEYEGYIEEKVKDGKTEEEAVKELGDFNEIVSDLLAAYKVKSSGREENSFGKFINRLSDGLDNFMNSLSEKSGKDIIKILFEVIIILFIVCLLKIPFYMIKDLGRDIFSELAFPIGRVFSSLWSFIIELSYVITAVIFFIKMLEKRYFSGFSEEIMNKVEANEEKTKETKEPKVKKAAKKEEAVREKNPGFISFIADIGVLFLKFLVLIFAFGTVCYLIGMTIAVGFMLYLIASGVHYIGVFILLLAMFGAGVFVLKLCIYFLINRKFKDIPIFIELISLIILTGLGLTFSTIEIASTEIIYDSNYATKSITKEINMKDNLKLYYYDKILIDNTLGDTIKIEYKYPNLNDNVKISIDLSECGYNGYCLSTNINHFRFSKSILNSFIKDLKDKKIYVNDLRVEKIIYASEENYKKLTYYNNHEETYNFVREYQVLNISDSHDHNYLYLNLKDINEDYTETVKVPHALASSLTIGNTYEFIFESKVYIDVNDIEEVFEECKLINISLKN